MATYKKLLSTQHIRFFWLWVTAGFAAVLFLLTHIPQKHIPEQLQMLSFDKFLHVIAYGMLTCLALRTVKTPLPLRTYLVVFLLIAAFGAFDEYTQILAGRSCSMFDWLANIVGITAVLLCFFIYEKSKFEFF